jgi:MutS domain V
MPDISEPNSRAPEEEYRRRLDLLRAELARRRRRDAFLGYAKLAMLALGLGLLLWVTFSRRISPYWLFLPVILFILLAVLHERVARAIERNSRARLFYERGLARIEDRWAGTGETGERFATAAHPYARDLDLFGHGGVFQLLCDARTRAGEEMLARWLLAPAPPDEVRARHAAVADLRERIDLREDLAVLGENLRAGIRPELLAEWAEGRPLVASTFGRVTAAVLAPLWIASLIAWIISVLLSDGRLFDVLLAAAIAMSVVNALFTSAHRRWIESASHAESACQGLRLLAGVMARFERETFSAPKLLNLQTLFRAPGIAPSRAVARLARRMDWLESGRNLIIAFVDRYMFYTLQTSFAIEAWRARFGPSVGDWVAAVGEIEALSSLAAYAYEHPADVFPEFTAPSSVGKAPCFQAQSFAHPLIPSGRAIRNDIDLGGDLRLMIVSGPNMAGKSTYVRAVGINAVLAQCGAPVRAAKLRLSPLSVAASVCVLDSLQGGISRFYAEILRVKATIDLADGPFPVLFLLDELLGGTNSQDRRTGAQVIVKTLVDRGAVGLITTHDLALAEIANTLGARAANFHFEDRIEDGKLIFDYRLSPGIVRASNALQLMRSIGIDV